MLRRWLRSFRSDQEAASSRTLASVADLQPGDLITFKDRLSLPDEMRGGTYEVSQLGTYLYDDGTYMQLTLVSVESAKVYLGFDPQDARAELCLSKPLSHADIQTLFDADQFADVFEEGHSQLQLSASGDGWAGWRVNDYQQTIYMATGYFYDRDTRGSNLSQYRDDDSEELRYHELSGTDDRFEITVEVWGDGETDVTLDVYCPADVIENLWPTNA